MSKVDKYYEILGVSPSSSISEIRRSYRLKAKQWHPDVNKSPEAHEMFILLREAYEYLTDLRSGRLVVVKEEPFVWTEQRTQEARNRAETYAGMNYREFKKSDYSRGGEALEIVADHINLVFSFIFSIIILSVLTVAIGPVGFFIGLAFSAIAIFFSYHGVEGGVDLGKFFKSFWLIISHRIFISVAIFVFNFVMVLMVGFQTLMPLVTLLWIYIASIVLMLLVLIFFFKVRKGFKLRFYPICMAPLLVNIFFGLNYLFSSSPKMETYHFVKDGYYGRGGRWRESSYIFLDGGKYNEYEGIRMFIDFDELLGKNLITYRLEEGLFGLRVMKHYELQQILYPGNAEPELIP